MQILEEKHPIFFGASTFDLKRFTQLQGRQSQRRIQGGRGGGAKRTGAPPDLVFLKELGKRM